MKQTWLRFLKPRLPILVLLLANLVVALVVFDDYGESWDENSIYLYSGNTLSAYQAGFSGQDLKPFHTGPFNLAYYGPFYFVVSNLIVQLGASVFQQINSVDLWHLAYFLSFLIAITSFFSISRRFLEKEAALVATLLFNTQPLLWGHAFINPKDIPFMAFFLATIASGLWMIARQKDSRLEFRPLRINDVRKSWSALPKRNQRKIIAWGIGFIFLVALLWSLEGRLLSSLGAFLKAGLDAQEGLIWQVASRLAPRLGEVPVSDYVAKAELVYSRLVIVASVLSVIAWIAIITRRMRGFAKATIQPLLTNVRLLFPVPVLIAGAVLGSTVAIRVIAPMAGFLVLWWGWQQLGRRVFLHAVSYLLIAGFVCYLLWPYLWAAPVARYIESLRQMSDFPVDIAVLFKGNFYRSVDLPAEYFPTLVTLQLTLPSLVVAGLGLLAVVSKIKAQFLINPWLPVLAWFFAPAIYIVIFRPTMYDNFRQFLFLLPPIILLAGLGFEWMQARFTRQVKWAITFALIIPGLLAIVRLHPYEYTFYNVLAGWSREEIAANYEMDYWATSYREAIQFLNNHAPQDAAVYLIGPDHTIRNFGRPDLVVAYEQASAQPGQSMYDFAILSTRADLHLSMFPNAPVIFSVERHGAVYAVVKQLK